MTSFTNQASGVQPLPETLDISDRDAVMAFGGRMLEQYGQIDVLVNNAGIAARIKLDDPNLMQMWDQVINVNLTAQWSITVALFAHAEARWRKR